MAFENITKGNWSIDEDESKVNEYGVTEISLRVDWDGNESSINNVIVYEPDGETVNADFIAYCFNLQQRFDISKLEEAVEALQLAQSHINIFTPSDVKNPELNKLIEQLLTQIKK